MSDPAPVERTIRERVSVFRLTQRARCIVCRLYRVLYRITVAGTGDDVGYSEARCADCWGMRVDDADQRA